MWFARIQDYRGINVSLATLPMIFVLTESAAFFCESVVFLPESISRLIISMNKNGAGNIVANGPKVPNGFFFVRSKENMIV